MKTVYKKFAILIRKKVIGKSMINKVSVIERSDKMDLLMLLSSINLIHIYPLDRPAPPSESPGACNLNFRNKAGHCDW